MAEVTDEKDDFGCPSIHKYYDKNEIRQLEEFHDLVCKDLEWTSGKYGHRTSSKLEWTTKKPLTFDDGLIVSLDIIKQTKNGVPMVRGYFDYQANHVAKPCNVMSYISQRSNVFHIYGAYDSKELVNHKINDFKYRIENTVEPGNYSSGRNWLFHEIFALFDADGKVVPFDTNNPSNNRKWPKMMGIMPSLSKRDHKMYRTDKSDSVNGTLYRSGYGVEVLKNGKSRLYYVLEMDIGSSGWGIVASYGRDVPFFIQCVCDALKEFHRGVHAADAWTTGIFGAKYVDYKKINQELQVIP